LNRIIELVCLMGNEIHASQSASSIIKKYKCVKFFSFNGIVYDGNNLNTDNIMSQ